MKIFQKAYPPSNKGDKIHSIKKKKKKVSFKSQVTKLHTVYIFNIISFMPSSFTAGHNLINKNTRLSLANYEIIILWISRCIICQLIWEWPTDKSALNMTHKCISSIPIISCTFILVNGDVSIGWNFIMKSRLQVHEHCIFFFFFPQILQTDFSKKMDNMDTAID